MGSGSDTDSDKYEYEYEYEYGVDENEDEDEDVAEVEDELPESIDSYPFIDPTRIEQFNTGALFLDAIPAEPQPLPELEHGPFFCWACEFEDHNIQTREDKIRHNNLVHPGISKYICDVCLTKYDDKHDYLMHHMAIHNCKPPVPDHYKCFYCGFEFPVAMALHIHTRATHGIIERRRVVRCNACENLFLDSDKFYDHDCHQQWLLRCHLCDKWIDEWNHVCPGPP